MKCLGIDEAGRGCVLGSLYIGGFISHVSAEADLRRAGAADSKALTHKKRVAARAQLVSWGLADVRAVPATAIDEGNMNKLEEDVIVDLINTHRPDIVRIDALGHPKTLPKVIARLQSRVNHSPREWYMETKADSLWAEVGAASIFAKTDRDAALDELRAEFGAIGSGYPSDPATKRWIADWSATGRAWPSWVRTKWGTIRALSQQPLM